MSKLRLFQLKSGSRDGLLLLSSVADCDLESEAGGGGGGGAGEGCGGGLFPNKISTSTLKRGAACKRTFLLKEKRESIV